MREPRSSRDSCRDVSPVAGNVRGRSTSAAIRARFLETSNRVTGRNDVFPVRNPKALASHPRPCAVTMPAPVTTTRCGCAFGVGNGNRSAMERRENLHANGVRPGAWRISRSHHSPNPQICNRLPPGLTCWFRRGGIDSRFPPSIFEQFVSGCVPFNRWFNRQPSSVGRGVLLRQGRLAGCRWCCRRTERAGERVLGPITEGRS